MKIVCLVSILLPNDVTNAVLGEKTPKPGTL